MRYSCWLCWFFWEGLPTLMAFPLSPPSLFAGGYPESPDRQWESHWTRYMLGLFGVGATAFILMGCVCCRKYRRSNGFQEKAGYREQEFKDGGAGQTSSASESNFRGLELEVPQASTPADRIEFEPILAELIIPKEGKIPSNKARILPATSSSAAAGFASAATFAAFDENYRDREERTILEEECRDWFDAVDLQVSRDKLKYLREIGHGWFGKVVEGRVEVADERVGNVAEKSKEPLGSVVVKILTVEASVREKAWFLGEAKPYLKLRHPNVLAMLGFCLDTDPYLLLFESCSAGDLKGFLLANGDSHSRDVLLQENLPRRMALEVIAGLRHMHEHGFAHTDLAARNCLVGSDLSTKLGDYGIAVEKYPNDYYVAEDRALPIRWAAPESLECTETTIKSREITFSANVWSYGILLWEIFAWGDRPYDEVGDERVIEMLLSRGQNAAAAAAEGGFAESQLLTVLVGRLAGAKATVVKGPATGASSESPCVPAYVLRAIRSCLRARPQARPTFEQLRAILLDEDQRDFDDRWENLPSRFAACVRSASLQDLHGSLDSDCWRSLTEEKPGGSSGRGVPALHGSEVRLGSLGESGSETEEESWRGRVERGVYSEKVKEKSKSVADLMVLVHIDSDSDAEERAPPGKRRIPTTGSEGDLKSATLAEEFDETLKKLRAVDRAVLPLNQEVRASQGNFLRLTSERGGDAPILRFSIDEQEKKSCARDDERRRQEQTTGSSEEHVLRLVSKGLPPHLPLLRYVPSHTDRTAVDDADLWNQPLDSLGFSVESADSISKTDRFAEDLETERKRLTTPDDERSSDSGFRDKESCEEEDSPPSAHNVLPLSAAVAAASIHEEEQLRILFELDTILDAEYHSTVPADTPAAPSSEEIQGNASPGNVNGEENTEGNSERTEGNESSERKREERSREENAGADDAAETSPSRSLRKLPVENKIHSENVSSDGTPAEFNDGNDNEDEESSTMSFRSDNSNVSFGIEEEFVTAIREELREKLPRAQMSVVESSEPLDEPNFLDVVSSRRWQRCARDRDGNVQDEGEDDDEDEDENEGDDDDEGENEDSSDGGSGNIDVSIRYNVYGAPLSPILEERESTVTTESLMSNSAETSIVSKETTPSEDILLVDTRTNEMVMLEASVAEGIPEEERENEEEREEEEEDDRDTTGNDGDISEDENIQYAAAVAAACTGASENKVNGSGAPLPSPEDENKWQRQITHAFPLPLPLSLQNDFMSTSFVSEQDCCWSNLDQYEGDRLKEDARETSAEGGLEDEEEEEEEEEGETEEMDGQLGEEEDSSSSSGEFVWKRYGDQARQEEVRIAGRVDDVAGETNEQSGRVDGNVSGDGDGEDEEEEEFTPSAWNATLAPHRSALRSPDKTVKSSDQKKSVWFKKQRYHCVYEYPKETSIQDRQEDEAENIAATMWEPTTYADWGQAVDQKRLDIYPMDYNDAVEAEFYVTSSSRPFQFQSIDSQYVSQFFPGASTRALACDATLTGEGSSADEVDGAENNSEQVPRNEEESSRQQMHQLGELRHTRNRLKLNLLPSTAAVGAQPSTDVSESNNELESASTEDPTFANFRLYADQCCDQLTTDTSGKT